MGFRTYFEECLIGLIGGCGAEGERGRIEDDFSTAGPGWTSGPLTECGRSGFGDGIRSGVWF